MTANLWTLIFLQMAMGGFDTLFHHEGTERLAWRPEQQNELRLHGFRNLIYALVFVTLGWSEPRGVWAVALMALLAVELAITLGDFVEEDRTRKLPASERVLHTLLTLNYGAVLALLLPWLIGLSLKSTRFAASDHGWAGWFCLFAACGVTLSGLRDLAAARRCARLRAENPAALAQGLASRSVLVTGGTGFIGRRLVAALAGAGHEVTVLSRSRKNALALAEAGPVRVVTSLDEIGAKTRIDAIVNLAGEPISDSPWTRAKRFRILRSRLSTTYALMRLIRRLETRPSVLVSGSAIGWYGLRGDEALDEDAGPGPRCFSQKICAAWERAAEKAESLGLRVVRLRIGLVLDRDGGMMARMLTPFEFGLGGPFGGGRQVMSWIHRDDLVRLIVHCLADPGLAGPVNATAPAPVANTDFAAALGRALRRPARLAVPAPALRLALGDFAEELLLGGQRVLPRAALQRGFAFRYPTLDLALAQIVGGEAEDPQFRAGEQKRARLSFRP